MERYIVEVYNGKNVYWFDHENPKNLHRLNGPATQYDGGTVEYFQHGKFHRENGPAVVKSNGLRAWYLEGVRYTEEGHKKEIERRNKPSCEGQMVEIEGVRYKLVAMDE